MDLNGELDICQKISCEIKNTFLQLYKAVKERETQLLRQIEVLAQHTKINNSYEKGFKQISVVFDNELDIILAISKFGRVNFNGLSHDSNFLKIEDYQHPDKDHVSLFKCVEKDNRENSKIINNINKSEVKEIVDNIIQETIKPQNNQIEKENIEKIKCEYPVSNVMLECIEKQDPSLCLYESSDKKKINELNEDQEHFSSCCSSPDQLMLPKYCDTENDLQQKIYDSLHCITSSTSEPNLKCICTTDLEYLMNTSSQEEKSIKDNINTSSAEELRNASDRMRKISMKQPVQVQQWMKQIISEPETEPAPSNVMEHSQIKIYHKGK